MLTVAFDRLGLQPGERVLDVGCGEGRHSRGVRLFPGTTAVAVDIGEKEVSSAASSLRAMDEGEPLPFELVRGKSQHVFGKVEARDVEPSPGEVDKVPAGSASQIDYASRPGEITVQHYGV